MKILCAIDLGLKEELLAHAHISPDGNWLTLYLKGEKNPAGIYLTNLDNSKTVLLGAFNDKNSTWTPDGSQIMFHFQRGGNTKSEADTDTEETFTGWYNLKLNNNSILSSNLHLIDYPKVVKAYTYQKHPSMILGTNFIVYHGQEKLMDRKNCMYAS